MNIGLLEVPPEEGRYRLTSEAGNGVFTPLCNGHVLVTVAQLKWPIDPETINSNGNITRRND
jgi:hypothetical protein